MLPMAVSVLACLIHAPSGTDAPAPKASTAALEMARLEVPREVFDEVMAIQLDKVRAFLVAQAASKQQPLRPGFAEEFTALVRDLLPYDEVIPVVAQSYDRLYTPAEMKVICAFLRSPEGTKMALNQPRLLAQVSGQIQVNLNSRKQEFESRLRAILGRSTEPGTGAPAPPRDGATPAK